MFAGDTLCNGTNCTICHNDGTWQTRSPQQFFCVCQLGYGGQTCNTSDSDYSSLGSCYTRSACIVPAIVVPVVFGLLLIGLVVALVVIYCRNSVRHRERERRMKQDLACINPIYDSVLVSIQEPIVMTFADGSGSDNGKNENAEYANHRLQNGGKAAAEWNDSYKNNGFATSTLTAFPDSGPSDDNKDVFMM